MRELIKLKGLWMRKVTLPSRSCAHQAIQLLSMIDVVKLADHDGAFERSMSTHDLVYIQPNTDEQASCIPADR